MHETYNEETDVGVLDKTWQEIVDAGMCFMASYNEDTGMTYMDWLYYYFGTAEDGYCVSFANGNTNEPHDFMTDSPNGYPTFDYKSTT